MRDGIGAATSGPGVTVGGMPLDIHGIEAASHLGHALDSSAGVVSAVGSEDVGGEEDAEGEEDYQWDQQNHGQQYQIVLQQQHSHYQQNNQQQQYDDPEGEQPHTDAPRSHHTSEGEDEVDDVGDSEAHSDISGSAHIDAPASPASVSASASDEPYEFEDDESDEDYDDPDDGEFVLPSRNRGRTSSSFPPTARSGSGSCGTESAGGGDGGFQYLTSEARSLRPRSASARYNPYPASSSTSSFENGIYDRNGLYRHIAQEHHGKRYTSPTPSADSGSGRSGSSSTGGGATTTNTITKILSSSASASLSSATAASRRRLRPTTSVPIPVPVPNLTKKSRGRRVPTMSSLEDLRSASSGAGKKRAGAPSGKTVRMYLCEVDGCGKCFARGEHLKRHVRSIHTYEKRTSSFLSFLLLLSFGCFGDCFHWFQMKLTTVFLIL